MRHDRETNVGTRWKENTNRASGLTTETKLVRAYDRPGKVVEAITSRVTETIQRWLELSETSPLYQFVGVEKFDGSFETKTTENNGWLPSAGVQSQSRRVTLPCGSSIRVTIERDP